jgi:hypothetical protein
MRSDGAGYRKLGSAKWIPALPELDVEVKQSVDFEAILKTWHRMVGYFFLGSFSVRASHLKESMHASTVETRKPDNQQATCGRRDCLHRLRCC